MNTSELTNLPIEGFQDKYGRILRLRKYLESLFNMVVETYGYEPLEIPHVERASSFDENIVGQSPWPEWDKRGCFYLEIKNYAKSYNITPVTIPALLIPEGTISVTRWLGAMIDSGRISFPKKIYYCIPCFRNELISEVTTLKGRQFNQFGMEILGASNIISDTEILWLILNLLEQAGINKKFIIPRVSNVEIFSRLINECSIDHSDSIYIKEALDTIAECKAGKNPSRLQKSKSVIDETIAKYDITKRQKTLWKHMLLRPEPSMERELLYNFGNDYHDAIKMLFQFHKDFLEKGYNVVVDLSVVRSHEYYTTSVRL